MGEEQRVVVDIIIGAGISDITHEFMKSFSEEEPLKKIMKWAHAKAFQVNDAVATPKKSCTYRVKQISLHLED
uniref:Uncharacterized protein n=1 Tax=viral metagenome TaxID=1070528 RepID=A0A6H1ZRP6_9ZZZZ